MEDEPLLDAAAAAKLAGVKVVTIQAARLSGRLAVAKQEPMGRKTRYFYRPSNVRAVWPVREATTDEV